MIMEKIYRTIDNKEFLTEREAYYHEKSLKENLDINTTQRIVFDLLERASFNGLDGQKVVEYLMKNKDSWIGVMPEVDGYALRDICGDMFNIDTVLVKCRDEETAKTFKEHLKRNCHPDEISIEVDEHGYGSKNKTVVRMWWD